MTPSLLLLACLATRVTAADDAITEPRSAVVGWVGADLGSRFDVGPSGVGHLGATVEMAFLPWVVPEAVIGLGLSAPLDDVGAGGSMHRFSFGTRITAPLQGVRPFLWLALRHEHQTPWQSIVDNPVGTTLGISEVGVVHKTGGELGAGIELAFPVPLVVVDDRVELRAVGRVAVSYLPDFGAHHGGHDELALFGDFGLGVPFSL